MREADKLRQQAEELLALAIKAREDGQFDSADNLLAESAKYISDAEALDQAQTRATQNARDNLLAQQLGTTKKN
ncbi:MAG TPA: hypothetical protein VH206_12565 [Xanthobacteraceae bacterium]|jgi:cellobiose-specific phosphotransferase system component IIA|nr:hypothetical protein [Xanthobacteraceae bacterium]